jgi:hypothetical protein
VADARDVPGEIGGQAQQRRGSARGVFHGGTLSLGRYVM